MEELDDMQCYLRRMDEFDFLEVHSKSRYVWCAVLPEADERARLPLIAFDCACSISSGVQCNLRQTEELNCYQLHSKPCSVWGAVLPEVDE